MSAILARSRAVSLRSTRVAAVCLRATDSDGLMRLYHIDNITSCQTGASTRDVDETGCISTGLMMLYLIAVAVS